MVLWSKGLKMAKKFITKNLIENDRTTDILSEQLRTGMLVGEGEMEVINLSDIETSTFNPRKLPWNDEMFNQYKSNPQSIPEEHVEKWEELKSLADSIAQNGLMQPIVITKGKANNDKTTYEIIAGERRYWASKLIDRQIIRAIVRKVSDENHRILALTENLAREDLSLLEKINGLKEVIDHNSKYRHHLEIQRMLGISRTQAFRLLKVIDSDYLYDLVIKGKITQISEIDKYDKVESIIKDEDKPEKHKVKKDIVKWLITPDDQQELLDLAKKYAPKLYEKLTESIK